jgi:hypothetical protein
MCDSQLIELSLKDNKKKLLRMSILHSLRGVYGDGGL